MARPARRDDQAAAQRAMLKQLQQQPAAELVGVDVRTLRDWAAPRGKDGKTYDGRKLVKWVLERERAKRKQLDLQAVEQQLRAEKLREAKRRNDVEDGLLVETETVGRVLKEAFAIWREQVKRLGAKYGPEVEAAVLDMIDTAFKGAKPLMPQPPPAEAQVS